MSSHTVNRIPLTIRKFLRIYVLASQKVAGSRSEVVRNYFYHTSDEFRRFQTYKLLRQNTIHCPNFPPLMRKLVGPIVDGGLDLGELENLSTDELFNLPKDYEEMPIYSEYGSTVKNFTNHEAQILSSFASYLNPYKSLPQTKSQRHSFKWYLKLLKNTPVFLILSQRHKLFSETSLYQINKPLIDINSEIIKLGNKLGRELKGESAKRNYHLTDLATIDIFAMALKSFDSFSKNLGDSFKSVLSEVDWNEIDQRVDQLSDKLFSSKILDIIDTKTGKKIIYPFSLSDNFGKQYSLLSMRKKLENSNIEEVIPFDMVYNQYYILTIEDPVLHQNHSSLLKLIEKSDFEVLGARISLENDLINDYLKSSLIQHEAILDYESLLQHAAKRHNGSRGNIDYLMKSLGGLGLTRVEQDFRKNCIYLLS